MSTNLHVNKNIINIINLLYRFFMLLKKKNIEIYDILANTQNVLLRKICS